MENSPFSNHFIGQNVNCSSKEMDFEIQKLQLMLSHKTELIEQKDAFITQKDKEIDSLKEIIALMKNKST